MSTIDQAGASTRGGSAAAIGGAPEVTADDLVERPGFVKRNYAFIIPGGVALAVIVIWELYGRIFGVDPLFFSYPSQIAQGIFDLAKGPLWGDLATSGKEFGIGMGIALLSVPLGIVIGSVPVVRYAVDPVLNGLAATPMIALAPLFVLWFGLGTISKVVLVLIIASVPLLINTIEGVNAVDRNLIRAARSFGARPVEVYRDVIIPGSVPFIVTGLRLGIGVGIIGVVLGEFIAAVAGMGYRIQVLASQFVTRQYLADVICLFFVAVVLNFLVRRLERRLAPWRATEGH